MADTKDISLNLQGVDEVITALDQLGKDLELKIIQDVIMKSALIAKKDLEQSAPDGNDNKPNADKLRNSVRAVKNDKAGASVGFSPRAAYIARFNEFGTKVREVGKKKDGKYKSGNRGSMPRHPFILDSHNRSIPKIIDFLNDNFLKLINNSLKKNMRKRLKSG
ncbi:MAG: hypothetical protein OJF59_002520 [Cytophagales bacterium]|jgi:HK97 gp10 family phage protein|nr:HK97 gp10 family phage protein [Bacteroidota bacterium]MBS1980242.1 HK97 gp10 family phage protein [Bacteroidota bacterium]WHZ08766.1 MAG: hypothetical protein OJF59_002520 [Cytophagales bacterium]